MRQQDAARIHGANDASGIDHLFFTGWSGKAFQVCDRLYVQLLRAASCRYAVASVLVAGRKGDRVFHVGLDLENQARGDGRSRVDGERYI